mmetsp:Transcript_67843/g.171065  ORF Transcript_67843/g.171065 Transcript_67843/m.171065 type:complete len:202 (-) Transcript_67843:1542-2147(-)
MRRRTWSPVRVPLCERAGAEPGEAEEGYATVDAGEGVVTIAPGTWKAPGVSCAGVHGAGARVSPTPCPRPQPMPLLPPMVPGDGEKGCSSPMAKASTEGSQVAVLSNSTRCSQLRRPSRSAPSEKSASAACATRWISCCSSSHLAIATMTIRLSFGNWRQERRTRRKAPTKSGQAKLAGTPGERTSEVNWSQGDSSARNHS